MPACSSGKILYRTEFTLTVIIAGTLIALGDRVFHISPFFQTLVMKLYLRQLLNALIALPIFLLWLELAKKDKINRRLQKIKLWWLQSRLTVPAGILFFALALLVIATFAYHQIPAGDAVWPYFQTKIFAAGRLFAPAPFDFRFFSTPTIIHNGRWFAYTSPGHSLVLLPFYLAGITWLAGPLLGTIGVWLLYRLTQEVTDNQTARITLLLSISSPFMLFLFASHEFHTTSVFFTILALFSIIRAEKSALPNRYYWLLLAGTALGMVFLARPYTAIGIGIPLLVCVLVKLRRGFLPFAAGGLTMVIIHLWYNHALTGNPLTFPYQLLGSYHGIGFSPEFGAPTFNLPGHSPLKLLINLLYNLFVLSLHLFGWLFFSAGFLLIGITDRKNYRLWLIGAPALGLIGAYLFYWFHGITPWGPKYWSEALPAFIVFTALGISSAPDRLKKFVPVRADLPLRALTFFILYACACYIPVHFAYFASGRWGETPKIARQVRTTGIHNAIVFIRTDERSGSFDYTSAFLFNDPFLKGDIIYPRDLGEEENRRFREHFPARNAYIYDFNKETLLPLTPE